MRHLLTVLTVATSAALVLISPVRDGHCAEAPLASLVEIGRPAAESGPARISVGMWMADISQIDSAAQTFTANLFVVQIWRDPRLAHGQPGIKQYMLVDIWHPKWLIANAAAKLDLAFPEMAEVAGDGTVTYRQRYIGTFAQSLDLRAFPFDHATFRIHFIAIGNLPSEIQFVPFEKFVAAGMKSGAGIAQELTLRDWRVTSSTARVLPYQAAPGAEVAGYAFEFHAERLKQHYIVKVIIPLLLIVMMSWMVFWIDQSMGSSQISVSVTSMLTLIAYRFAVGNEVPKLPYLTNLDAFILVSTILVFLALIEVVVTTVLWFSERKQLAQTIDRYCRVLFPIAFVAANAAILLR